MSSGLDFECGVIGCRQGDGQGGFSFILANEAKDMDILDLVKRRDPGEPEFHQAVTEVIASIKPVLYRNLDYRRAGIVERMVEPERVVASSASWEGTLR